NQGDLGYTRTFSQVPRGLLEAGDRIATHRALPVIQHQDPPSPLEIATNFDVPEQGKAFADPRLRLEDNNGVVADEVVRSTGLERTAGQKGPPGPGGDGQQRDDPSDAQTMGPPR